MSTLESGFTSIQWSIQPYRHSIQCFRWELSQPDRLVNIRQCWHTIYTIQSIFPLKVWNYRDTEWHCYYSGITRLTELLGIQSTRYLREIHSEKWDCTITTKYYIQYYYTYTDLTRANCLKEEIQRDTTVQRKETKKEHIQARSEMLGQKQYRE